MVLKNYLLTYLKPSRHNFQFFEDELFKIDYFENLNLLFFNILILLRLGSKHF